MKSAGSARAFFMPFRYQSNCSNHPAGSFAIAPVGMKFSRTTLRTQAAHINIFRFNPGHY
jgi:hypothetical protein